MLPSGRGGIGNFQARGVTKGQFATASKRLFDSAEVFLFIYYFITSNNLGQPWMALRKIDEEEGEGIGAGGVKSVYLCMCCLLPLQNADWVNNRHLERDSFAKGFFFYMWLRLDLNVY